MSDTIQAAGFATLAIHAGAQPDLAAGFRAASGRFLGDATAMLVVDEMHADPAVAALEERVAALEGGTAAVAVASGAAAPILALHTLLQPGDELVVARQPGAGPDDRRDAAFRRFGWQVRWADPAAPASFVEALSDRTKAILIASIAEPGGRATDIESIAGIARRARVPLVVDNTLATPYLVRPFDHGADIVLHAGATLLGGQTAARGGLVVDGGSFCFAGDARYPALSQPSPWHGGRVIAEAYGNFALAVCARASLPDLGGAPSALDAFLLTTGIETLPLRMRRHCDNALAVARHLERQPGVSWVRHAGLDGDAGRTLAERCCPRGTGAAFAIGLADAETAATLVRRLRLFAPAAVVGGTRSLVLPSGAPAPGSVRLWVGLEDVEDIIVDLDLALAG